MDQPSSDVDQPTGIAALWAGGAWGSGRAPAPHGRGRGPAVATPGPAVAGPEAERSIPPRVGRLPNALSLAPRVRVDLAAPGGVPSDPSSLSPESGDEMAVRGDAESLAPHDSRLLTSQSRELTGHALRPDEVLSVA